jgi:glycerate kinase
MNGFSGTALVAVAALALAGCGGTNSPAPKAAHASTVTVTVTGPAPVATAEVTASTSPPMTPGPAAYLAWAQKGASPADVSFLTDRLRSRRAEYSAQFGIDVEAIPGSGAAGGLAGGLAVIGASLVGGFDQIARELELDRMLADADLVITGEGKFDATSLAGKVVGGVWRRAAALGLPVVAIVGVQDPEARSDGLIMLSLTGLYGSSRALSDTSLAITDAVAGYLATQTQRGH